jgi:hypothetical protein
MSPETVAGFVLAGCAVGGAIGASGVLAGLVVGRRFRELPRIRCVATDWELRFEKVSSGRRAVCTLEVYLFNEGQLATGVRGISIALHVDGERVLVERLRDSASEEPLWSIDLPPRRWTHASAWAIFEHEEARQLEGFRRADLLGWFPDGGSFELKIVERQDFVASPKRDNSDRHDYVASRNLRSRFHARRRSPG